MRLVPLLRYQERTRIRESKTQRAKGRKQRYNAKRKEAAKPGRDKIRERERNVLNFSLLSVCLWAE